MELTNRGTIFDVLYLDQLEFEWENYKRAVCSDPFPPPDFEYADALLAFRK